MKKIGFTFLFSILAITLSAGDDFCGTFNSAFISGERITFKVFYNVIGIYVDAGTASFNVSTEKFNNKPVYHITGEGTSNSRYDWIFKVRDKYESYVDTTTLVPYKFVRNIDEGGFKKYENITFNREVGTAVSTSGVYKVPGCIQDVLSAIYYSRNINFDKYKVGDKIPFTIFLDDEVHSIYVRYMGKETVKTRYGKFKSIKLKPLLIKGTMFEGGEKMTVWVSDDQNRLPLRVESPISVGSVKVDMMGYFNLRYRLSSMLELR
jgi:hypothetical protein